MKEFGKRMAAAAVTAGMVSLLLLGCGSGADDSSSSVPLTKAQLLKAGDKICRERLKEKDETLRDAVEELPSSQALEPSQQTLTQLGESISQPVQKMIEELRELSTSSAATEKMTRELEAGLNKAEAEPSVLIQANPFTKAGEIARAYGFKACVF
jgi:hypothetical protein